VPHANAYPVAGRVRDHHPAGYPPGEPLVPHGTAVALTAPEAFRWTFEADPARHLEAARLLEPGVDTTAGRPADVLPGVLRRLMRDIGLPDGLAGVGYGEGDVDALVEGAVKQQRLLATSPRPVTEDDLAGIIGRSLNLSDAP
jgi:alcohol dehydrogenase class IV